MSGTLTHSLTRRKIDNNNNNNNNNNNRMVENIKKVLEAATVTEIQKICVLGSAQILRKVLSV